MTLLPLFLAYSRTLCLFIFVRMLFRLTMMYASDQAISVKSTVHSSVPSVRCFRIFLSEVVSCPCLYLNRRSFSAVFCGCVVARNHAAFEDGEIVISIGFFPAFSFHFFFVLVSS